MNNLSAEWSVTAPTGCVRKCTGWRVPRARSIVMPIQGCGNAPGMTRSDEKIRLQVNEDGANMLATIRGRKCEGVANE